jgi:GTP pyrophosphokinase
MLEDAAKRQSQTLAELMKPEYTSVVLDRMRFTCMEDLYSAIGFGGISAGNVLHKLMELKKKSDKVEELAEKIRSGEGGEAVKAHVPSTALS